MRKHTGSDPRYPLSTIPLQPLKGIKEFIQVVQGHALITVGEDTAVFGPEDGVVAIPRFTIHQYGRADDTSKGAASRAIDLIVKEWTDPADGEKEVFFRNVLGLLVDRPHGFWGASG